MQSASRILSAAALCLLALTGCSGDSPSSPRQVLVLEGTLETDGRSAHPISLADEGAVVVDIADLRPILIQLPVGADSVNLTVGLGLGRPDGDECDLSSSFTLAELGRVSFGLAAGDYCLEVFDSGSLPDDALIGYALSVTIS